MDEEEEEEDQTKAKQPSDEEVGEQQVFIISQLSYLFAGCML